MSNLLAIPLVNLRIETGNNEDWVDSFKYVVATNEEPAPEELAQLDLRGITFDMEIRRAADDPEVILGASTNNGTLAIGAVPDYGYLLFNIPFIEMRNLRAGPYVGDIVGRDGIYSRVVARIELTIIEGVTKQPVNQRIVVVAA